MRSVPSESYASRFLKLSEMRNLTIVGWREGMLKISMSHVLREHLSLGMKAAKDCVDDVIAGRIVSFRLEDSAKAQFLAIALEEVGAIVSVESDQMPSPRPRNGET